MTVTDRLRTIIELLGYSTEGLVLDRPSELKSSGRQVVWTELREKAGVDAAFFRGSVPLVAFVAVDDRGSVREVHKRLWNLSRLPLLIVSTPEETSAFSCFVPPTTGSPYATSALLKTVPLARRVDDALAEFSRFHVEAGRLKTQFAANFRKQDRVDRKLLQNLRDLRRTIGGTEARGLAIDALIGRTIFVRYLEDRGILSPEHLADLAPHRSLIDCLEAGKTATYALFQALAERFNGDVFAVASSERAAVTPADLSKVARFLAGEDVDTGQQSLWPYDFSVIPPELVSSIYEQLLEVTRDEDAAHYTPRSIVGLMLDEVLPWGSPSEGLKVLDPACGSGIFLSEAFRRLAANASAARERRLTYAELRDLLTGFIFGIDRNPRAIAVAAFGLYLTLLEQVDPPTIWRDVRLPSLVNENLVVSDFFETELLDQESFEIIVGNPPWKSALTQSAREFLRQGGFEVPDQQIAWAFAFGSCTMLAENGLLALLLPSKSVLHNKAHLAVRSRLALLEMVQVDTLIDLSALRRDIFAAATAPAVVVIAHHRADAGEGSESEPDILHVAPRGSPLQDVIDGFVVSQDDIHRVPYGLAESSPDIWKVLLWGDLGDHELISRLRAQHRTLGALADEREWDFGRGFQVHGGGEDDASALQGLDIIPAEAIHAFAVDRSRVTTFDYVTLHRRRGERLYQGPHILIRRGLASGMPVSVMMRSAATFNDSVIGVAGRPKDLRTLRFVNAVINSSLGRYYHFLTSSSWGVERDYIDEAEHLSLPVVEPTDESMTEVLRIAATAERRSNEPERWQEPLDQAVFDAYRLSSEDVDRVRDLLAMGLGQFRDRQRSVAYSDPDEEMLDGYVRQLSSSLALAVGHSTIVVVLERGSEFYNVATVELAGGRAEMSSELLRGDGQRLADQLAVAADETTEQWPAPSTIIQPSLVILDGNRAHFVKPRESRYWTTSKARSDAADLLGALLGSAPAATAV